MSTIVDFGIVRLDVILYVSSSIYFSALYRFTPLAPLVCVQKKFWPTHCSAEGSATFFSYIDTDTMKMDTGFTEHSGCPVLEGEKKIVTQWVRLGVDDDNPWNSFNTLGIKVKDAAQQ